MVELRLQALAIACFHQVPDHLARLRPPQRMLRELGQHSIRRLDQRPLRPVGGMLEQHAFVRHAGAVVDPVVDREAVAEILEDRPARRARDQPEARDDQPLEEDLHQEDLLLQRVRLEEHVAERVEVRITLALAPDLADQLEPRLGVARLVLHHRGVIEPRLGIGRRVEQLRRHLDREDVRLQLLHHDGTPDVLPPRQAFRRALPLRHRGDLAPRQVAHHPLLVLRQLVEAQHTCVGAAVLFACVLVPDRLGTHGPGP